MKESNLGIWSGPYLPITIANLTVMALAAFDGLAVIAALPSIAADLGQVVLLPWVSTAYLGTSAVAVLIGGPIIDAIGVRRTFRIIGIWFLLSSALTAISPTMIFLVFARIAHGFGGGMVMAVVLSSVGLAYPGYLRRRAFAANSLVWGVMGFGGPAITGLLISASGWRFIFAVQVPLTALALFVGWSTLPGTRRRPIPIRTDFVGIFLICVVVALSLVAVDQIGIRWSVAATATVLVIITGSIYWWHSGRIADPILARTHITRFPLAWVHLTSGLVLIAGLAVDNYLPLYVQLTRGKSVEFAAFSITSLSVGWTSGSFMFSRVLSKWSETDVVLLGAALSIPSLVTTGVLVFWDLSLALILGAFFFVGLSVGLVVTAGLTLVQATSDENEIGRSNAAHQFIRNLSITFAVAIGGSVILSVVNYRVGDVELVRSVLSGENIRVGVETMAAVGDGLALAHVPSVLIALVCFGVAISLTRRSSDISRKTGE